MNLTVGQLEDKLRQFPKNTSITLTCRACHHGSSGGEDILKIEDNTSQTFGCIEIGVNNKTEPNVDRAFDKEEFYKKEVEILKAIIEKKESIIKSNKDFAETVGRYADKIKKEQLW